MTREEAKKYIYECLDRSEATEIVEAFEQEPSEWQRDHAILKAHSDGANEVIDRVKQAREELSERIRVCISLGGTEWANGLKEAKGVLDKLIAEVEG